MYREGTRGAPNIVLLLQMSSIKQSVMGMSKHCANYSVVKRN
jgi:hypothetical protein